MNRSDTQSTAPRGVRSRVRFKVFRGGMTMPWEDLLGQAAEFAESLPPGSLINISHSSDHRNGIVVVWYRSN